MGKRKGEDITGIFLLDKDKGISSNVALQQIRRLYNAKKAGHTGSLDPMATGLLPICFGKATKICQYLLDSDKAYKARIQLGIKTDSGDAEGAVIETVPVPQLSHEDIQGVCSQLMGEIEQTPPMYSALKKDGVPLYKLARQGIEIERKVRNVTIYQLDLEAYDEETQVLEIYVKCSKGTYVRTLAEDIASKLGTVAHLTALRRTQCGLFSLTEAQQYFPLKEGPVDLAKYLVNVEAAFADKPTFALSDFEYDKLMKTGQFICDVPNNHGLYRLYHEQHKFFGVAVVEAGKWTHKQLFI